MNNPATGLIQVENILLHFGYAYGFSSPSVLIRLAFNVPNETAWMDRVDSHLLRLASNPAIPALKNVASLSKPPENVLEWMIHWFKLIQGIAETSVPDYGKIISREGGASVLAFPLNYPSRENVNALIWLMNLINCEIQGNDSAGVIQQFPEMIRSLINNLPKEQNTPYFLKAAHQLEIPVTMMPGDVFLYGYGSRSRLMHGTFTNETSVIAARLSRNKSWAAIVLGQFGIPVPPHVMVNSADAALEAARALTYPVVIKPADLDGGAGVAAGLMTPDEVRAAFEKASKLSTNILVEKHFEGRDHRLTVFQGEVIWATERIPGGVTGDGTSKISKLVDSLNADPRRGLDSLTPLRRIALDVEALDLLQRQGMNGDSVPGAGKFVRLRRTANINTGGTPVAVFDRIHPDNRLLAIRAAAALSLDLAGVDLLISDIGKSWKEVGAAVCEVNAQPAMGSITSTHLYSQVLRKLIPGNGRIPIALILGESNGSILAMSLGKELQSLGLRVGLANSMGVLVSGVSVCGQSDNAYQSGRLLLMDRNVDAVVLSINDPSILRSGLPFDRFDVLVIAGANITPATGQDNHSGDSGLKDLLTVILPTCQGKVIVLAESGLKIREPAITGKAVLVHDTVEIAHAVAIAAEEMLQADARYRAGTCTASPALAETKLDGLRLD